MRLVDLGGVDLEREPHERLDLLERVQVGLGLAGDGLDELEDLGPVVAPPAGLALHLLEEQLLALHAAEIEELVVPEAHVVERLLAAHELVAGLQVDGLVVRARRDEVLVVDGQVDAAEDVDHVPEAGEVDLDPAVDGQAGDLLEGLDDERRPAVGVGLVHLVETDAGDVDLEVARQREHGDALRLRVEAHEHLGVRAAGIAEDAVLVGADEQDVHRLVGQRQLDLLVGRLDRRALLGRAGGGARVADLRDEAVRVADGEARRGQDEHDHGDADQLDGEVTTEGDVGGDEGDGGHHDDRRPDHRPFRHLVRGVDDVEGRAGVADRLAAEEPVQERPGHRGGRDERPDPPAPLRRRRASGTRRRARSRPRPRRGGLRLADVLVFSDFVDPVAAHAPPPRRAHAPRTTPSSHD